MKELNFINEYEKFIAVTASGKRLTASGKRISKGCVQNYQYTKQLLEEYEVYYKKTLRLIIINKATLSVLQKEKNYWSKFYRQFSTFLYKHKGYHDIYVLNTYKNIKVFFNYLNIEKGVPVGQYHKLFKTPLIQFSPVVFSPEQLNFLITNEDFYNTLTIPLNRVSDIVVVGCTFGLRVSDLMQLKKSNIVKVDKEIFLSLHTHKTTTEVRIPVPDYVLTILSKYKKENSKLLLPQLSSVNINKQIKRLAEHAGWTSNLPKFKSRQGKIIEVKNNGRSFRFCDHLTAHTMRRTAITTLLILGVPELVVRKLSGHAPGSKEFYRYIAIANEYSNQQIKQAQEKLVKFNKKEIEGNNIRLL